MKEIKFRSAHYFYNGLFSHFSYWGRINHKHEIIKDKSMFMSPSQSSETEIKHEEQFTGLKDKNGKEIYEGDKIMMYGDRTDAFVSKVFFSERFASFEIATTGNSVGFYHKSDIEVIGNIHESPELTNANK